MNLVNPRRGRFSGPVILLLSLSAFAHAQVTVSFPLDGYCRPGHYMPVEITINRALPVGGDLSLHAEGAMDVTVANLKSPSKFLIPWLIVHPPVQQARWTLGSLAQEFHLPQHPLAQDERLVGYTTDSPAIASKLFPGKTIIPVHLDPAAPIPGDAAAWECLDALVLDLPAAQRITPAQRDVLLAAGTAMVVQSKTFPDQQWNWQRMGDIWVLRNVVAPSPGFIEESAYLPTDDWTPGWPAPLRRKMVLAAVVFSILVLGILLLRPRWSPAWVLLLVIITLAGMRIWLMRQSPVSQVCGSVIAVNTWNVTVDRWTYQTSTRAANASASWRDQTHPVFFSEDHWLQANMRLACDSTGRPMAFVYRLSPGVRQAFVSRSSGLNNGGWNSLKPDSSPMKELARRMYLPPGSRILGQLPARDDWPTIVVQSGK